MMLRLLAWLLAAGAALAAARPPADRLDTAGCRAARAELEAALDDPGTGRAERAQRLAALRQKVSVICLGPAGGRPQRSGAPQRVLAVPAPIISAPPLHPTARAPSPPRPAVAVPRPAVVTTCDAAGCWDSDGHRLNNLGPMLVGPRGVCTVQGATANCP